MLVVQGENDPFGRPPPAPGREVVLLAGDHSLKRRTSPGCRRGRGWLSWSCPHRSADRSADRTRMRSSASRSAAIGANVAPVRRARSAGASSISSPRRPPLQNIVGSCCAEASTTVGSRFRWPSGEMPPAT